MIEIVAVFAFVAGAVFFVRWILKSNRELRKSIEEISREHTLLYWQRQGWLLDLIARNIESLVKPDTSSQERLGIERALNVIAAYQCDHEYKKFLAEIAEDE